MVVVDDAMMGRQLHSNQMRAIRRKTFKRFGFYA